VVAIWWSATNILGKDLRMPFEIWLNVVVVILSIPGVAVSILALSEWIGKRHRPKQPQR
jgi:hypothetical protein